MSLFVFREESPGAFALVGKVFPYGKEYENEQLKYQFILPAYPSLARLCEKRKERGTRQALLLLPREKD